ncbi:LOW QUALITY PROTEIN: hypothetical protein CVT26_001257 [Gymnopilus dilepis]|uniref:Uncharacterized protein n=1 Tax=Gymnopilus dilepis TaxID=231916 RepID=A0A409Y204_9AGAR|nr:LOW QUALITY PROTEIN: hypothetical protein CVT26_001257 [Gymnopilus dilepis]
MALQYNSPYPQNWYMEGGTVERSIPEENISMADIEKESQAVSEAIHLIMLRTGETTIIQGSHADQTTSVQCLLFATCGEVMPVWTRAKQHDEADVLQLPQLFPNGYHSYRISLFPVLNSPMMYDWRIYVTQSPENGQLNAAIGQRLGVTWRGNIVLAKYGNISYLEKDWLEDVGHISTEFAIVLLDA